MKWRCALMAKWIISAMLLILIVTSFSFVAWSRRPLPPQEVKGDVQMGFYDLMSRRKEIYDSSMKTVNNTILTTITSPDDNRFVLKGKFTEIERKNNQIFFSYTSIYSSTYRSGLMIDGLVDLLLNVDVWMEPLNLNGQPLVVGQSGMIFLYPLRH